MAAWWNGLTGYQHVLFVIACATTLIMLVQIIMMLFGFGDDSSFDADTDVDLGADGGGDVYNDEGMGLTIFGMRVLSVRSILAFFAIGSWVVFTLADVLPVWAATLLGIAAGVVAAFAVAFLMKSVEKLQSSGNIEISNAVGKTAEVYLTVPAKRSGTGKVNVFVQERYVEFEAVTDDAEPIKTGAMAKVVTTLNQGTLVVESFSSPESDGDGKSVENNNGNKE